MKKFVAIPEITRRDVTKNKEYPIILIIGETDTFGKFFTIKDNVGFKLVCLERECTHLNDGNWEIKEVD